MADKTGIEWTNATWNPTTGCDRISPGCDICYALIMAKRLKAMGSAKYQNDGDPRTSGPGFAITEHPDALSVPLRWRGPRRVFVNSMSDLGHARVSRDFAAQVWAVMAATPQHTYQILSKRPERMRRMLASTEFQADAHSELARIAAARRITEPPGGWPLPNVWMGTSIESEDYARRADELRATPAAVRFLSLEPLIGPLPSLSTEGIDWAIIGGESGSGARPMRLGWVDDLIARCRSTGTAVFVKQLGTRWAEDNGQRGKGGDWDSWPADLRVREFPAASAEAA